MRTSCRSRLACHKYETVECTSAWQGIISQLQPDCEFSLADRGNNEEEVKRMRTEEEAKQMEGRRAFQKMLRPEESDNLEGWMVAA